MSLTYLYNKLKDSFIKRLLFTLLIMVMVGIVLAVLSATLVYLFSSSYAIYIIGLIIVVAVFHVVIWG